ncbi:MAG: MBL fold metallo-hydrolase [Anaerolineae bacterium]|nr:MBL fold metallo-hydrolase [Anaerolineae bacterium]
MKLTFLGGADEVGASCTLIEIAGKKILVDVGIRISPKTSRGIQNDQLPDLQPITAIGGPDYILVTHAHTDHTGALPLVMEQYPYTPVLMTRPSEALVRVLQKDALKIMLGREAEGELPLFDEVSVNRLLDAIQLVEFNQAIKLAEGLQVTYHVAGHIAGAAMLVFESSEGTLVMSGDVSKSPQRTVKSVEIPKIKADALVLESTYGGRLHANRDAEEKRLIQNLKRITERGGKVLIPAFALGRSQELVQIIHAFSDQIDVPVFVDGMVRTVCDAYARFADLLPKNTVKAAGEEHLFFRGNVKPIRNPGHREQVARHDEPLIVIASSGMLTGGASVAYAKQFANDERNAILLTGYQDEESPGRFLQRVMRQRQDGVTPTLNLAGERVSVRCEIDTYSLSAHADESELINVAQAFNPEEIMLVHGDEGARHSLATGLRQRQIITTTPRIGTERSFTFKERPWAIGVGVKQGANIGHVDLVKLWESVKGQAGSFFSSRELAQIWWGDGSQANAMKQRLNQQDNVYFSADWRNKDTFQIRSEAQVKRAQHQREIMLQYPQIVGQLVVLRNSNNQPRLGVVKSAEIDSFDANVQNAKGTHYPADALLWVVGKWQGVEGVEGGTKKQLAELLKTARAHVDVMLPFLTRKKLVDKEKVVNPESLLPDELPEGIDRQTAITSIVLALAKDGATLEKDGLKPHRARENEPLEQNEARELALASFPPEAHLRKVGMDIHRKQLMLSFDFPQAAMRLYDDQIENLIEQSGWEVKIKPSVNQQALAIALDEILPEGVRISKGPSYHMARREVQAELADIDDDDLQELPQKFLRITDFKLTLSQRKEVTVENIVAIADGEQLEINQAYAVVRRELEPLGMYKCGMKQGQIVLSFISPQLAERYREEIHELAKKIGYTLTIHPHPNQQKILEVARKLAQAVGWTISKGPSIHVAKGIVGLSLSDEPNEVIAEQVANELEEQTGFQLEIN